MISEVPSHGSGIHGMAQECPHMLGVSAKDQVQELQGGAFSSATREVKELRVSTSSTPIRAKAGYSKCMTCKLNGSRGALTRQGYLRDEPEVPSHGRGIHERINGT